MPVMGEPEVCYAVCSCSVWPCLAFMAGQVVGRCGECGTYAVSVRGTVAEAVEAFLSRNGHAPVDVMP